MGPCQRCGQWDCVCSTVGPRVLPAPKSLEPKKLTVTLDELPQHMLCGILEMKMLNREHQHLDKDLLLKILTIIITGKE